MKDEVYSSFDLLQPSSLFTHPYILMTDLPPEPPPDPAAETQVHIPEFKREGSGLPMLGLIVIFVLFIAGAGLLTFAFVYGQQDTENRAINGTVAAVLSFTSTPMNTRPPSSSPVPTTTSLPTDPASQTPLPSETPTGTVPPTAIVTATSTRKPTQAIVLPSATPAPPTATPPPPIGARGITGSLQLCDPSKTSYAANAFTSIGQIERVCILETIKNNKGEPVTYSILGVLAQNTSGGPSQFQTSWRGDLKINGGCTGPSGDGGCGGAHTDTGFFIDAVGTYNLSLRICYSTVDVCVGNAGDWETLGSSIPIQIISWTPSP